MSPKLFTFIGRITWEIQIMLEDNIKMKRLSNMIVGGQLYMHRIMPFWVYCNKH